MPLFRTEEIDLYRLFRVVASRGGFLRTSGNRAWNWVRPGASPGPPTRTTAGPPPREKRNEQPQTFLVLN